MDNSGDYISREAAIELLKMALDDDWEPEYAADRLSEVPAADVRPAVRGKWIDRDDAYYGWNVWACSDCGDEFVLAEGTPDMNDYHYCPNCGADMRPEEEGE